MGVLNPSAARPAGESRPASAAAPAKGEGGSEKPRGWGPAALIEDRQWFILYVVVCLEVGVFLALVPWSAVWERNYFLEVYPSLRVYLLAPSIKGAVAGLGLANIYMGLNEVLSRRRAAPLTEGEKRKDAEFAETQNRKEVTS